MNELVKLFGDRSESVKLAAVRAVAKGGEIGQMYAACMPLYDMSSTEVRKASIEAIAGMGRRGLGFTEEVEGLLEDPVPVVRDAATKALAIFEELALADAPPPAPLGEDGEPLLPVALIFPGQGSQYVKMLEGVKDLPAVQDMLAKAQTILGYDILDLCLTGPEEKLQETKYCQPAMYIGGLAAVEQLRQDKPDMVAKCRQVAGLSLGEYTALTVAGVFDFETGLKLVKLRGEAMQAAAEASEQKMLSVAGLELDVVERLCKECAGTNDTCQVANFLFPKGFSCAGSKAAIEKLEEKALATEGCLQAKALKITGAFHTSFMEPAKAKLMTALKEFEDIMKPPKCEVYMNATATKIAPGTPPADIIPMLADQLCSCVMWEPTIRAMIKDGITEFYECGPMKQLKAMMKRIDMGVWKNTTNIGV
uniref:Malonyl-CoA:ACP transacylase (MAT) domain-containing protein n=1 Tax=Strombidinopsis acuminata TaxID=141414 RepID=A0A7S3RDI1_9SPIT